MQLEYLNWFLESKESVTKQHPLSLINIGARGHIGGKSVT